MKSRVLAAVLTIGIACTGKSSDSSPCRTAQESAECFTADFYKWYVRGSDSSKTMEVALRERGRDLAPPLRNALGHMAWIENFNTGGEVISYDLFINGQDWCGQFVPGKAEVVNGRTRVPVYDECHGKRPDQPHLIAEVVHGDSGFQFANFLYPGSAPPYADMLTVLAGVDRELSPFFQVRHGCPFECCRYGDWTLTTDVVLHSVPGGDSTGVLRAGLRLHADSGFVILSPVGLAVVVADSFVVDLPSKPRLRKGDTLYLLDYIGEGHRNVRWRDTTFDMEESWNAAGSRGIRLERAPASAWWVHFTDGPRQGWVEMTKRVQVKGADACG